MKINKQLTILVGSLAIVSSAFTLWTKVGGYQIQFGQITSLHSRSSEDLIAKAPAQLIEGKNENLPKQINALPGEFINNRGVSPFYLEDNALEDNDWLLPFL